jgi:hypothetical protein
MRFSLIAAMLVVLLASVAVLGATAGAQTYPPPVGSLSAEGGPSPAAVGGTSTVTATVRDGAGEPVAGAEVVLQIASQPGAGAVFANGLSETTASTDVSGVATAVLTVGSTAGNVIVDVTSGDIASQVTVQVQSPGGLPPTGGSPSSEDDGGLIGWRAALIVAGAALIIGGGVVVMRRRR